MEEEHQTFEPHKVGPNNQDISEVSVNLEYLKSPNQQESDMNNSLEEHKSSLSEEEKVFESNRPFKTREDR